MELEIIEHENAKIVKVPDGTVIDSVSYATDLLGNADYLGANKVIISESNLNPQFFDLKTGLAGEILQKISNYHMKLAIIGEFKKYNSKSLNAFITECNRGNQIFFVPDIEAAYKEFGIK